MAELSVVRIGSRESQLAMTQTMEVKQKLEALYPKLKFEVVGFTTIGDKILDVPLSKIGEKSLFTKELEVALEKKQVDLVVHSLKDLPTLLPPGMKIGAILEREDPRDCVIFNSRHEKYTLDTLPPNSVLGTSSLRRVAQLKKKYPDLQFETIRGNLNTRLQKLDKDDKYCGIILAVAGMKRLGFGNRISQILDRDICHYSVGQGALAIECLEENEEIFRLVSVLNHKPTVYRCLCERAFMRTLEGGCSIPIGVYTEFIEDETTKKIKLSFEGAVFSLDGSRQIGDKIENDDITSEDQAKTLGETLANQLIERGAKKLLDEIERETKRQKLN